MLAITESIAIPDEELDWSFARSGGPGGQNVNKVASKAHLRWAIARNSSVPEIVKSRLCVAHPAQLTTDGEFLITSQEYRDQERNRERCVEKLVEWISAALVVPKPRVATKPSKASKRRRVAAKRKQGERKAGRKSAGSWDE